MSSYDPTSFVPQEPEEKNFTVLPAGEYPFKVTEVFELIQSKQGNDMIPIQLEIMHEGEAVHVDEYLVFTDKARWKIDSFLKCIGPVPTDRPVNFTAGSFIAWVKKQKGRAKIGVEIAHGKTKDFEKNKVEAFLYDTTKREAAPVAAPAARKTPPPTEPDDFADDIPF